MEFRDVVSCRRSIRSFTGETVSEQERSSIIRAANASPVGLAKYESVHLTDIRSRDILNKLEQLTAKAFGAEGRSFLYGAPELIVVSSSATDSVGCSNAAIIAHNMALAAVDLGVGVCHIWGCIIALAADKGLIKELGIPEGFTPVCAVALGKSSVEYTEREIPDDRISLNTITE